MTAMTNHVPNDGRKLPAMRQFGILVVAALLVSATPSPIGAEQTTDPIARLKPDVIYVPTPTIIVERMLKMAQVTPKDVVYDLGCGDGRIVIEAAKHYGARGVGIDIVPRRIAESRANARREGVSGRIEFRLEDFFDADISEASVVTLYLLPTVNMEIRRKLWRELAVGARVVSHAYDMGDWTPDRVEEVIGSSVYLWTITEETKKRLADER
jgi:SAM-dependent methyltransferase